MKKLSPLLIIISGILWGCMGVFSKTLNKIGFDSMEGSAIRLVICAVIFVIINFRHLKINTKDIWKFISIGIFSIFTMSYTYFESIRLSSLTLASILLYTAPFMVTMASYFLYKEKMTPTKIICLILAFSGIIMISGADSEIALTPKGLIFGLLSGASYALYSIIGKNLLKTYKPETVCSYAFIFASVMALITTDLPLICSTISESKNLFKTIIIMSGCGVITAAAPYTLYTLGLKYAPAGKASILACVEPLTACLIGIIIYGDKLGIISLFGIFMIFTAVIWLSKTNK